VNKAVLKQWYLMLSLVLSLFLVVVTILGFMPLGHAPYMETLHTISIYVLCFFVIELVVLFFLAGSFTSYLKEQWISIIAVLSSLSVAALADGMVAIGSLTGLKALKGVKGLKTLKTLKSIKGFKLVKATKGAKIAKTVKIAKKTKKARKEARKANAD
jgi:hypothetical protein